jgi:hypothetical protein
VSWAKQQPIALPLSIHSMSLYSAEAEMSQATAPSSFGSATWPSANLAIYVPFSIPWPFPVKRMFWANGSAAGGNIAVGIYSIGGTKIYASASTGGSGNSAIQYVTVSPELLLVPGRYYLALIADNVTANRLQLLTLAAALDGRFRGLLQQAVGSMTLPDTLTAAQYAQTVVPFVGIHRLASGF